MKNRIEKKLKEEFSPNFLEVKNNSALHRGHAGNPDNSDETHFAIAIKSEKLSGNRVEAHRKINQILMNEFESGLHALEIKIVK